MELQGNGFTLRGWRLNDTASLQHHANNVNIAKFLLNRFPSPYTVEAAELWVNRWQDQNPMVNFAIAIGDEVIGGIGIELREDIYYQTPLLGYWLAEPHWGKGIMPQAVKLITDYAFANLDVICIVAYVLSKNPASMRVLKKAGYELQGIIKQSVIKGGNVYDEHIYAINKLSR